MPHPRILPARARIADVREYLAGLGARPAHARRVLHAWVRRVSLDRRHSRAEDFLPKSVRAALPVLLAELEGLARQVSAHPGQDASMRLLLALADGQSVESVLLPGSGLCVSTQVGCAVGCAFCMTGQEGLKRQLGSAEIVAQVALARRLRPVRKVVCMGMGEPAHNLDNVLEAIQCLGTEGGIGHKNLVFSTVGDARVFERLLQGPVKPALALSLHTTRADLRARLLPRAPAMDPAELVARGEVYARATGHPIQYQWTLLAGVNDSEAEVEAIARMLAGKYAMMNFIPYNSVPGLAYQRPAREWATHLAGLLRRRGIVTHVRNSAGQDVEAGCGQLRARGCMPRQA
ncbi:MAG TPA: RNA methyltransferase [Thiobacillaceae bacterium]|nr:RNA methyltransferase [Thiobacillaceae bacterium]HNU63076.1 RNA methyltransferase [Thiobacillaceae bacterium]